MNEILKRATGPARCAGFTGDPLPGEWCPVADGKDVSPEDREFYQSRWWAIVRCPGCAKLMSLSKRHTVAPDGTVSPSLVCPHMSCTWHVFVQLEGWERAA